jgi:formylglycine-generating enzyme required for sulfatase activity
VEGGGELVGPGLTRATSPASPPPSTNRYGGAPLDVETPALGQTHPVDGKQMILIPPGDFLFGAANKPHSLAAFFIDATPVTNSEYARFIIATKHREPHHWLDGSYPADLGNHPVVYVSHQDAAGCAAWAGEELPSVEQWEKTARGPSGLRYPWGDQPTAAKCNVRESGAGRTTPVDRYHSGVSTYGVYDLSGNTWEWCGTQTAPGRYALKGSAFTSPFSMAVAAATNDADASMMDDDAGFRCVSDQTESEVRGRTQIGDDHASSPSTWNTRA